VSVVPIPESEGPQRQDDRRRVAVVTTTVHVPRFLAEVLENARQYGHQEQVAVVVVGDRKTPAEVSEYLAELARRWATEVTYLDVPAQGKLLRRWPVLDLFVRYNCIQRRNVGYLRAALDGAEVIISVDDDNFVGDDDFIGHHLAVGREVEVPLLSHPSGWWNVCQRLLCDPPRRFYPRGYPKSRQDWQFGGHEVRMAKVRAVVNAGLWLETPDVDATAHLEEPIHVLGIHPIEGRRTCALAAGTWCPVNSQNTAFDVSTLPAMYLPVMRDVVGGYRIGRMDDVWMSYFVQAIAAGRGEAVLFGPPLVVQRRNPHDHLADLTEELPGYLITERLVGYLRRFESREATYRGAYEELIYHLRDSAEADDRLDVPQREYFRQLTLGMAAWLSAVRDIVESGNCKATC